MMYGLKLPASGNWVQAFELLVRGLSAGNPDACAYQHAFAIFVQLGMTRQRQLAGSDEASDAEDWVCCLKEVFVLQAWIVRATPFTAATQVEVRNFAEQLAGFTMQYRQLDLLWNVTHCLCPSHSVSIPTMQVEIVRALQQCSFKQYRTASLPCQDLYCLQISRMRLHTCWTSQLAVVQSSQVF